MYKELSTSIHISSSFSFKFFDVNLYINGIRCPIMLKPTMLIENVFIRAVGIPCVLFIFFLMSITIVFNTCNSSNTLNQSSKKFFQPKKWSYRYHYKYSYLARYRLHTIPKIVISRYWYFELISWCRYSSIDLLKLFFGRDFRFVICFTFRELIFLFRFPEQFIFFTK